MKISVCRALLIAAVSLGSAAGRDGSPDACAPCHRAETAAFADTAMARALASGQRCAILRANPKLALTMGAYSYQIVRSGNESIYSVTDGKETLRVPIEWAFGQGAAGQTYVFRREGKWYESRVSYFSALRGLGLTLGGNPSPRSLAEAAGRPASPADMRRCFDCHATNLAKSQPLSLEGMVEGVQCERCHGGSEAHVQAARAGRAAGGRMKILGALTTGDMSNFCGQCHRTWEEISLKGPRGIANVRFQPYRLANSRCYDPSDSRIKCTACHNPHRELETAPAAYDARCLACHSRTLAVDGKPATMCKVAQANCVTCHMPRLDLPGAHQKFTDHRIRIVRANQTYPD